MALLATNANRSIFREYIGSKSYPDSLVDFPDIINPKIKEFHFIIAFAAEKYDDKSGKGTGQFYKNWNVPNIDGTMIQNLKNKYGSVNVKVVISIGGRGTKYPFNPVDKETWPDKARDSLIEIFNYLKSPSGTNMIDGIDINYDTIIPDDENVFANCIGKLINSLKNTHVSVISISPSLSVCTHYEALYKAQQNNIDWVNYQFYTHSINSAGKFEELYRKLAKVYSQKLLAGFSTDPDDAGNLPVSVFIKACEDIIESGELPGIFIWNANDSATEEPPFDVEKKAQNLLAPN